MRRLTYAMQFHRAPATSGASGAADPPTTASGLSITTQIADDGVVASTLEELDGGGASMDLAYTLGPDQKLFFESGTISFGDAPGSTLQVASVGTGSLLGEPGPDGFSQGVVSWSIEGGSGFFADATGAITSNFLVNLETEQLIDTHVGVISLP